MTSILHISSSPRGDQSLTRQLGDDLLARLTAQHPDAHVVTRDLVADPLPHIDGTVIGAMFTPPEQRSATLQDAIVLSDALVDELSAADIVVIESPMYNWSTPSGLKAWIDHVVRIGRTFLPTDGDYRGLLHDRPVYVIIASGGVYTHGPRADKDFLSPYLRHMLGFVGISDVRFVHAEGVVVSAENALASARDALAALRVDAPLAGVPA